MLHCRTLHLFSAGEYRTGKRISMRRVIGYIASHYRKDKIWLRRTRPDIRRYQVRAAAPLPAGRDTAMQSHTTCKLCASMLPLLVALAALTVVAQPDNSFLPLPLQVVIAVDDSRSMAENACGPFALEALALLSRALAGLNVGELGVVSFGGSAGVQPLHPLGTAFTDSDGMRVMGEMRFDQVGQADILRRCHAVC